VTAGGAFGVVVVRDGVLVAVVEASAAVAPWPLVGARDGLAGLSAAGVPFATLVERARTPGAQRRERLALARAVGDPGEIVVLEPGSRRAAYEGGIRCATARLGLSAPAVAVVADGGGALLAARACGAIAVLVPSPRTGRADRAAADVTSASLPDALGAVLAHAGAVRAS
jgi:hypothetical protein